MNFSVENLDEVTAKLIVEVSKDDYEEKVKKSLKSIKQKINMPGFRKGMVPMSLVQKMYGAQTKIEEVQNVVSDGVNNYIKEQNIKLMASPMANEDDEKADVEAQDDFKFTFDLALEPKLDFELTAKDKIDLYNIIVDDKLVDEQIDHYRRRNGDMVEVDTFSAEDLLRGSLVELDENGGEKADGVRVDETTLMPRFFSNDEQKALFEGAKKDGEVVFSVAKAYDGKDTEIASILKVAKEDVANHQGDFKFTIKTISHMQPAEVNQKLFDSVLGEGAVKSEEEFKARIKADMEQTYAEDSNYKFILDARDYCLKKVGEVKMPEALLKREQLQKATTDEAKQKVEAQFADYMKERLWTVISERLIDQLGIKIESEHIKDAAKTVARSQFAQYGMTNIPDNVIDNYAEEMMKDEKQIYNLFGRALDIQLSKGIKGIVKLNEKKVTVEEFNKLFA